MKPGWLEERCRFSWRERSKQREREEEKETLSTERAIEKNKITNNYRAARCFVFIV